MSLYQRQLDLEDEYSTASLVAGQQLVLDAFKQGRAADIGKGRILLAKAYEVSLEAFHVYLAKRYSGLGGKYRKLLQMADPEVLVMAGLREVLNNCANPEPQPMQAMLTHVGKVIESEAMLKFMTRINERYTERTIQYLDAAGTKSVSHRYRTFLAGAKNMGMDWNSWSADERRHTARLLLTVLHESTGLFRWVTNKHAATSMYYLAPSEALAKHFQEVQGAARALVKYPPMLLPPMEWKGQNDGGYLTDWFRHHSPMCGLRYIQKEHRAWILDNLNGSVSAPVRAAMTKAQNVPYRINSAILKILRAATAMRVGILGLPSFVALPEPVFPLGDNWQKDEATETELEQFQFWKSQMAAWYTSENKRKGRHTGILGKITELARYENEERLYFPTFIDWRGRLYFRSNLNPQSNDAVKGCIEFAEGKRLGTEGLFWLKVHVANSCGYDKHDPAIKAQWVDDNWSMICDFINNPLEVDAPEPDTAFTLLQAGLALQEALSLREPTEYTCHVPVAMDATCSGLQHLSALTRDPIGAYYTNLIDNGSDQKSDIYMRVAEIADESKIDLCVRKNRKTSELQLDPTMQAYWKLNPISRAMAKNPVMTFVYGSTLLSTIDTIALGMSESGMETIKNDAGKVLYSYSALATPVGKALRKGVQDTVPESARMMKYMQGLVRAHKEHCMTWITPMGVPVVNWAEGSTSKRIKICAMGVEHILMRIGDNAYNTRSASNGIVPNFVHSMDSAHLCATILDFDGQVLPIHDSFATHPSDVAEMHKSLRSTFVKMYQEYSLEDSLLQANGVNPEEHAVPVQGNLDLNSVLNARFI